MGTLIQEINSAINTIYVGILETGDLIFLSSETNTRLDEDVVKHNYLNATIHYRSNLINNWELNIGDSKFQFYLPDNISVKWNEFNNSKLSALNIKREYFSRIVIFKKNLVSLFPFVISINQDWLDNKIQVLLNKTP